MNKVLEGKIALVTGSSRGLGEAIARALFEAGATPVITYQHNEDKAKALSAELGNAPFFKLNVTKRAEIKEVMAQIDKAYGRLDILVNNAGILEQKPFLEITEEEWDETLGVNLKGPFMCIQEATSFFARQNSGCVINMSSVGGQFGGPKAPHYAASKGALLTLTKSMARLLADYKVRVNAVAPGFIRTDMYEHIVAKTPEEVIVKDIPLKQVGEPEDVGQAVVYLASEHAKFITGEVINLNGGQFMGG